MTRGVEHIDTIQTSSLLASISTISNFAISTTHRYQRQGPLCQPSPSRASRFRIPQTAFRLLHTRLPTQLLINRMWPLGAGGQHGELALRPLHSPSGSAPHLQMDSLTSERPPAPWLLRTPTGGSINNAITIQPDLNHPSSSHNVALHIDWIDLSKSIEGGHCRRLSFDRQLLTMGQG